MSAINTTLSTLLHTISDHGNTIASKVLTYFGLISVGGGGALGVSSGTISKISNSQQAVVQAVSESSWEITDTAACVSTVGGVCFIIKLCVDIYFKIKNGGKD